MNYQESDEPKSWNASNRTTCFPYSNHQGSIRQPRSVAAVWVGRFKLHPFAQHLTSIFGPWENMSSIKGWVLEARNTHGNESICTSLHCVCEMLNRNTKIDTHTGVGKRYKRCSYVILSFTRGVGKKRSDPTAPGGSICIRKCQKRWVYGMSGMCSG
jgi:hypothetical protein